MNSYRLTHCGSCHLTDDEHRAEERRRVRFLDAAGVKKRAPRNNPEKAVPRKERKAQAEAAAKA